MRGFINCTQSCLSSKVRQAYFMWTVIWDEFYTQQQEQSLHHSLPLWSPVSDQWLIMPLHTSCKPLPQTLVLYWDPPAIYSSARWVWVRDYTDTACEDCNFSPFLVNASTSDAAPICTHGICRICQWHTHYRYMVTFKHGCMCIWGIPTLGLTEQWSNKVL